MINPDMCVTHIRVTTFLISHLIPLDSPESQEASQESAHEAETQHISESSATVEETAKDVEQSDNSSTKGSKNSLAALDQVNVTLNGDVNGSSSDLSKNVLEISLSTEVSRSESDLLLAQEDGNLADNETESDVKDVECERTSDTKSSEEKESKEENSDTEESDFVDAEAINGIEMLPSTALDHNNSEQSGKNHSTKEQSSKETKESSHQESEPISTNGGAQKDPLTENTESSNEGNLEEPELQHLTNSSQEDLLPSSTDAAAESSSYETPRSSEASPTTTSGDQSEVVTAQPKVTINGVPSGNSVTDSAPIPPPRKAKKKGVPKGLSSSSLGACFPMACTGNASPTFNLSRVDSVYGGSVRSR